MNERERSWESAYRLGSIVALTAVAALLFDIVLAMVPGWEPATAALGVRAWFEQFASDPLLGIRNLDFLNVVVALLSLPMYVALFGAHRHREPAAALLALLFVSVGTVLFAASNAALPVLELSGRYAAASGPERAALEAAGQSLLARGAHGSFGAFPGFLVSEIGTAVMALAMLRGRVFRPLAGWAGLAGATILAVYSALVTFTPLSEQAVMAIAAPGGLLTIVWQVMVARGLWRLSLRSAAGTRPTGR